MPDRRKGFPTELGGWIPGTEYGKNGRYVEISGGSQLAKVERPERKFRQDGYRLAPMNNGADGWGYSVWYPARQVDASPADLSKWEYYPRVNQWRKVNRRTARERWAAQQAAEQD